MNNAAVKLDPTWVEVLKPFKPYLTDLAAFLTHERSLGKKIYPPQDLIFNALNSTPYPDVKVVIIGQDPYHGPGQAHGLCFSVPVGVPPPPSLQNIFKELKSDLGLPIPSHGCLDSWAKQGVLLLNTTLTVEEGKPLSHKGRGWERFTDEVIGALNKKETPLVFLLWGNAAKEKFNHVPRGTAPRLILTAAHPSPLSCHNGFHGCGHFSKTNQFLQSHGIKPINWSLE